MKRAKSGCTRGRKECGDVGEEKKDDPVRVVPKCVVNSEQ
jgi:hypothetical protein